MIQILIDVMAALFGGVITNKIMKQKINLWTTIIILFLIIFISCLAVPFFTSDLSVAQVWLAVQISTLGAVMAAFFLKLCIFLHHKP